MVGMCKGNYLEPQMHGKHKHPYQTIFPAHHKVHGLPLSPLIPAPQPPFIAPINRSIKAPTKAPTGQKSVPKFYRIPMLFLPCWPLRLLIQIPFTQPFPKIFTAQPMEG